MKKNIVKAPKVLCLYDEYSIAETLKFIANIYECVNNKRRVILDFSNTEKITSAASVALFAHVNRIQLYFNVPDLFTFRCQYSPLYDNFFKRYYLKALKADTDEKLKRLEEGGHIYQSGVFPHLKLDSLKKYFRLIRANYQSIPKIGSMLSLLETALFEALLNIHHHAYLGVETQSNTRWWQQLKLDVSKGNLSFIVYDLGIGIVESYLNHGIGLNNVSVFHSKTDILRDIFKPGVSRLNAIERGNGFSEMLKPMQGHENVGMWIFTNNLHFECFQKFGVDICKEMPYKIPGTLIEWVVDLRDN